MAASGEKTLQIMHAAWLCNIYGNTGACCAVACAVTAVQASKAFFRGPTLHVNFPHQSTQADIKGAPRTLNHT